MIGALSDDSRAHDPQTVEAIRALFNNLIDQNKPEKGFVMEISTYETYLKTLLHQDTSTAEILPRFSNRKRFEVGFDNSVPYLARKKTHKRVYHKGELFGVIFDAHIRCQHGDGKKIHTELKEVADNIFLWECILLTKLCYCKRTKIRSLKAKTCSSPKTSSGDLLLINMDSFSDINFPFLLIYRDVVSQFMISRPLKSKNITEVATELVRILHIIGAPLFINSTITRSFMERILTAVYSIWPECPTVYGQQLINERHAEFSRLLDKWLHDNPTRSWTMGASFVCSFLNSQFNRDVNGVPYSLIFREKVDSAEVLGKRSRDSDANGDLGTAQRLSVSNEQNTEEESLSWVGGVIDD